MLMLLKHSSSSLGTLTKELMLTLILFQMAQQLLLLRLLSIWAFALIRIYSLGHMLRLLSIDVEHYWVYLGKLQNYFHNIYWFVFTLQCLDVTWNTAAASFLEWHLRILRN